MSIAFPTGGGLYYTDDLENVAGSASGPAGQCITGVSASVQIQAYLYGMDIMRIHDDAGVHE